MHINGNQSLSTQPSSPLRINESQSSSTQPSCITGILGAIQKLCPGPPQAPAPLQWGHTICIQPRDTKTEIAVTLPPEYNDRLFNATFIFNFKSPSNRKNGIQALRITTDKRGTCEQWILLANDRWYGLSQQDGMNVLQKTAFDRLSIEKFYRRPLQVSFELLPDNSTAHTAVEQTAAPPLVTASSLHQQLTNRGTGEHPEPAVSTTALPEPEPRHSICLDDPGADYPSQNPGTASGLNSNALPELKP